MEKFVLLRDGNFTRRIETGPIVGEPVGSTDSLIRGTAMFGQIPPEPLVEFFEMGKNDIRDARRDPSVIGMARPMPLRLIEPFASQTMVQSGPTWGVEAIGATFASAAQSRAGATSLTKPCVG